MKSFFSQVPQQQSYLIAGDGLLHQPVQQSAGSSAQPQPPLHHPSEDLPAAQPPAPVRERVMMCLIYRHLFQTF